MGGFAAAAGGAAAQRQRWAQGPLQPSAIHPLDPDAEVVGQARAGGAIAVNAAQGLQPLPESIAQGCQPLRPYGLIRQSELKRFRQAHDQR